MNAFMLVSDVDNTLLGDDGATARFAAFYHEQKPRMRLALNSGRFYESLMQSVQDTPLPLPDAIIGGVGTDIRFPPQGGWLETWHDEIRDGWDAQRVKQALRGIDGLELQPAEFQSAYKLSYYYYDATPEQLNALDETLRAAGLSAKMVYSSQRDLDFLPQKADKGTASAFLAAHWGLGKPQVMASGDSGNDIKLFEQGFKGIVVGNAHGELLDLKGDDNIYFAQAHYADGVLEGIRHWLGE